jgi:hypothetical protein
MALEAVLRACGDDVSTENIVKQACTIQDRNCRCCGRASIVAEKSIRARRIRAETLKP